MRLLARSADLPLPRDDDSLRLLARDSDARPPFSRDAVWLRDDDSLRLLARHSDARPPFSRDAVRLRDDDSLLLLARSADLPLPRDDDSLWLLARDSDACPPFSRDAVRLRDDDSLRLLAGDADLPLPRDDDSLRLLARDSDARPPFPRDAVRLRLRTRCGCSRETTPRFGSVTTTRGCRWCGGAARCRAVCWEMRPRAREQRPRRPGRRQVGGGLGNRRGAGAARHCRAGPDHGPGCDERKQVERSHRCFWLGRAHGVAARARVGWIGLEIRCAAPGGSACYGRRVKRNAR